MNLPGQHAYRTGRFVLLLPAVVVVTAILFAPFAYTIVASLLSDGVNSHFAGLDNYIRVFTDPVLQRSIVNTIMWVAGSLLLPVGLGLLFAVMTNSSRMGTVARGVIILPFALSGTAIAVVGSFILQPDGALNQILGLAGLQSLEQPWLQYWPMNTISAILFSTWQATGAALLLFMVGLQGVPTETLEAAAIDGANGPQRFWHIILPQLRPISIVVIGTTIANSLRGFDFLQVLTQGGPARSSETLALSSYFDTFLLQEPNLGAAVSIVLTIVVLAASWIYLRRQQVRV